MKIEEIKGYLGTGLKMQHKHELARHGDEKKLRPWITKLTPILLPRVDENFEWKLILHPLSDLTKYCEDLGFVPTEWFEKINTMVDLSIQLIALQGDIRWLNNCDYLIIKKLYEWHFDIHGKIPTGEAIDINTL